MSEASARAAIEALFQLPLGEFTAARNTLAAQLKNGGRHAEASEAKALTKPSVSAWAVNQLYWRHRKLFDRLIETGDRLRKQPTGDSARELAHVRREAVIELAARAAELLQEAGHGDTHNLLRRVTSTLDALSSYGSLLTAPPAGRLIEDVEPPGFEAALGMLPAAAQRPVAALPVQTRPRGAQPPAKPTSRAKDVAARRAEQERKRLATAAKTAVRAAARVLNVARKHAERAAAIVEKATARAEAIDGERARIEKRLARLAKDADAAHAHTRAAAADADRATKAAADAERDLGLARQRLRETGGSQ